MVAPSVCPCCSANNNIDCCCCIDCTVGQQVRLVDIGRCKQQSDGRWRAGSGECAAAICSLWRDISRLESPVTEASLLCRYCPGQCRVWTIHRPLPSRVPHLVRHGVPRAILWQTNSVVCFGRHGVWLAVVSWPAGHVVNGQTADTRPAVATVLSRRNLAVFNTPILDTIIRFCCYEIGCTRSLWRAIHCRYHSL